MVASIHLPELLNAQKLLNFLASLLSYLGEQLYPKTTLNQIFLLAVGKQERGLKVLK